MRLRQMWVYRKETIFWLSEAFSNLQFKKTFVTKEEIHDESQFEERRGSL